MTREIKFRAWDKEKKLMFFCSELKAPDMNNHFLEKEGCELMQFTGLKDKNGTGQEVYEGDIIDEYGKIKGNIYEMDKGETDLVIEGLGTASWAKTEMAGLGRGLKYAE